MGGVVAEKILNREPWGTGQEAEVKHNLWADSPREGRGGEGYSGSGNSKRHGREVQSLFEETQGALSCWDAKGGTGI